MAPGFHPCQNLCQNFSLVGETDKLVMGVQSPLEFTISSNSPALDSSCICTSAPTLALIFIKKLFKQFIRTNAVFDKVLKQNQVV